MEEQAMDCCHRLGQTKPVEVRRFVIRGSVEECMLGMQMPKAPAVRCGSAVWSAGRS